MRAAAQQIARPFTRQDAIRHAVRRELVADVRRELIRMPSRHREISIESDDGHVALTLHGNAPERVLFSPSEARKLIAEIEQALNRGFGRDMDAIRRSVST
ncbi:hypothetical protein [Methylocella sp. CPCC 101449]|uniref:hypothetical protein n=1 Tax=Methylocella sp. CPCC 101449 TaxID=2987531 RepID=UPI00288DE30D|nr:hypothetical protein [Methylocella sp. CPCC 101449]MDT2020033.1 hypothetical protein [Methylocella sp. CPCC 101449]